MQSAKPADTVCITAMGMVSPLGYDVFTACAAARAGISRATELEYFRIRSREDGEVESVLGHPVPYATLGFEGLARLLVLSRLGLEDLLRNSALGKWEPSRTGFYLSLPDVQRVNKGFDLISDNQTLKSRREQMEANSKGLRATPYGVRLCQALSVVMRPLAIAPSNWFYYYAGHCGAAAAVKSAVNDLQARKIEFAVVGGVDSLIEEEALEWLLDTGRLKTGSVAAGLQPGEAGVFLLLERYETAAARKAAICGVMVGIEEAVEEVTLLSGKPALGIGLSHCIAAAVANFGMENCRPFWIAVDQNGEPYRAYEWGYALTRLLPQIPELRESILWYPAAAFGDTGAASGLIAICMVIRGFERDYAVSDIALVLSSSDDRERSAIVVARS